MATPGLLDIGTSGKTLVKMKMARKPLMMGD